MTQKEELAALRAEVAALRNEVAMLRLTAAGTSPQPYIPYVPQPNPYQPFRPYTITYGNDTKVMSNLS